VATVEVDIGGDEQTMPEIAETFSRVIGREVDYYQVPWDQFEEQMGEEYAASTGGSTTWVTRRI
jgi:uncharacterized protein YbjT (DUF2867 family)